MAFEDTDRRRTLLLALLTLVVLPVAYFLNRGETRDGTADNDVAAAEVTPSTDPPPTAPIDTTGSRSNRPALEPPPDKPVFLDGELPDPEPGVVEIAIPPRPEFDPMPMTASYRSSVAGAKTCLTSELDAGLTVTVTNLDNGRSIECVTAPTSDSQTAGVVLHTDAFSLLADLTDAPVPVEVAQ
jgi:hypothetical protein